MRVCGMTMKDKYKADNFLFDISAAVDAAVERLKDAYGFSQRLGMGKLYVCFSGGKDSECVYLLCRKAFGEHMHECCDFVYNMTGIDPPELVYFIREYFPDVIFSRSKTTIWDLCVQKRMPPTRVVRYCCSELKERGGKGRFVVTGVRWAESVKRRLNRGIFESYGAKSSKILNADNSDDRRTLEHCVPKQKYICNPIVDWGTDEVWRFIIQENMPYCMLYDEGFSRMGCIGCPMSSPDSRRKAFDRWPKYKSQWIRTFQRMVDKRKADGLPTQWNTGDDVFTWWIEQ